MKRMIKVFSLFLIIAMMAVQVLAGSIIRGDMNGDYVVNQADAIYLLRHVMNPNRFQINQSGDVNGDGFINSNDAIYLSRHIFNPDRYPLK